jgi:hypothetical protein
MLAGATRNAPEDGSVGHETDYSGLDQVRSDQVRSGLIGSDQVDRVN